MTTRLCTDLAKDLALLTVLNYSNNIYSTLLWVRGIKALLCGKLVKINGVQSFACHYNKRV